MSGKPSPEAVRHLLVELGQLSSAQQTIERLESEIANREAELKERREIAQSCRQNALRALEQMDVAANHNAGWDARVISFLVELCSQAAR